MHLPLRSPQRTLKSAIHCTGIGLHTGVNAAVTLRPAPADTGILFRRLDGVGGPVEIPAHWTNAVESSLCTMLTDGRGTTLLTIEHLMSALAGCGIDNCVVEVIGPEIPVMDGSAGPFVFLIECAGIVEQPAPRRFIRVLKPVQVGDAKAWARIEPDDSFTIDFEIDFAGTMIGRQRARYTIEPARFKRDISRARTFGFMADVDKLRAAGRALGASLENAVVIEGDRVVNDGGLRYANEFVRHKILDAVGDLYLAGFPLVGHFIGRRSSHALNRRLLQALLEDATAWTSSDIGESAEESWAEPLRARA